VPRPPLHPPRFEGALRLPSGRSLGFAEFGPPGGRPLLWFHGTPGARRQIPPRARELAHERGVRLVSVERPGVGESTPHAYPAVVDFAADVERLCDALGIDRFGVAGLSGGGPYALACAHALAARVVAAVLLSGVAPAAGPDAAEGGVSRLIRTFAPLLRRVHRPVGGVLRGLVRTFEPLADLAVDLFARQMPPGDQRLFEDAAMRRMFQEDLILASRLRMQAVCLDVALFARPWGFALAEIEVPVHLWYGDSDNIVPVEHGRHLAERIPGATLRVRAGEGHLGGLGASDEVFSAIFAHWPGAADAATPSGESSPWQTAGGSAASSGSTATARSAVPASSTRRPRTGTARPSTRA
jgi:pimeloyl-ACP methyl ester carboxylesterase